MTAAGFRGYADAQAAAGRRLLEIHQGDGTGLCRRCGRLVPCDEARRGAELLQMFGHRGQPGRQPGGRPLGAPAHDPAPSQDVDSRRLAFVPPGSTPARAAAGSPRGRTRVPAVPRGGDLLRITRRASVQFRVPMLFRVIRVDDRVGYAGWLWLYGYQLDDAGEAVAQRWIFVQANGLQYARSA